MSDLKEARRAWFKSEASYRATMSVAHRLKESGLVNESDIGRLRRALIAKYQPIIGRLDVPRKVDKQGDVSDV